MSTDLGHPVYAATLPGPGRATRLAASGGLANRRGSKLTSAEWPGHLFGRETVP
jgi:hypothetical protein